MKQPPEVQTDKEVLAGGSPGKSDETAEYPAECEGLWNLSISSSRGVTDEVATLVRDFVPTRFELQKLAKLYFEEHAEYRVWWMQCGGSGRDEIRSEEFALRRLDTIGKLLTKEQFAEAIDPVKEDYDPQWAEAIDFIEKAGSCKQCGDTPHFYEDAHDLMDHDQLCLGCRVNGKDASS